MPSPLRKRVGFDFALVGFVIPFVLCPLYYCVRSLRSGFLRKTACKDTTPTKCAKKSVAGAFRSSSRTESCY